MDTGSLKSRIQALLAKSDQHGSVQLVSELQVGTVKVMQTLYGADSSQEKDLRSYLNNLKGGRPAGLSDVLQYQVDAMRGALKEILEQIEVGFIGSLRAAITGEVLSDFIKLCRQVLDESQTDGKNVAAVLCAASFEDTMRRIAAKNDFPNREKLADTLEDLKKQGILQGAQVGIAQSYLGFRNKALHAKWDEVEAAAIQSCLGFTEEMILGHLS